MAEDNTVDLFQPPEDDAATTQTLPKISKLVNNRVSSMEALQMRVLRRAAGGVELTLNSDDEITRRLLLSPLPKSTRRWFIVCLPMFFVLLASTMAYLEAYFPDRLMNRPNVAVFESGFLTIRQLQTLVMFGFLAVATSEILDFDKVRFHPQRRDILFRSALAHIVALSSYVFMVFGDHLHVIGAHDRPMNVVRCVQWCFSTPLLGSMISRLHPENSKRAEILIVSIFLMQVTGWVGTFSRDWWGPHLIIASWVFFIPVLHCMFHYYGRAGNNPTHIAVKYSLVGSWFAFPAIWCLDWFHIIPVVQVEAVTCVCDFMAKAVLTMLLSRWNVYNFHLSEKMKIMLERDLARRQAKPSTVRNISIDDVTIPVTDSSGKPMIQIEGAAIVKVDVFNYSRLQYNNPPAFVFETMSGLYRAFDEAVQATQAVKIKILADGYLCMVNTHPTEKENLHAAITLGLKFVEIGGARLRGVRGSVRVGIDSGPLSCSQIRPEGFVEDVFGTAIRHAHKLESSGTGNRVHISDHAAELAGDGFICDRLPVRGTMMNCVWGPRIESTTGTDTTTAAILRRNNAATMSLMTGATSVGPMSTANSGTETPNGGSSQIATQSRPRTPSSSRRSDTKSGTPSKSKSPSGRSKTKSGTTGSKRSASKSKSPSRSRGGLVQRSAAASRSTAGSRHSSGDGSGAGGLNPLDM